MYKLTATVCIFLTSFVFSQEDSNHSLQSSSEEASGKNALVSKVDAPAKTSFKAFTGKIKGKKVRLRVTPDLDSPVVQEMNKDDLLVIVDEKEDFWAVQPPKGIKAYIFRSFVLDNVVEGNRVNVRISPHLEAPVIGHLSSGTRLDHYIISSINNKWLEIDPPEGIHFFIAKEYVEYAGGPELKKVIDQKKSNAEQFLDAAYLVAQGELRRPFEEIDIDRVNRNFTVIMNEYRDFPEYVNQAQEALDAIQETYLQKKISYLEAKAFQKEEAEIAQNHKNILNPNMPEEVKAEAVEDQNSLVTDKMKIWEPIEENLFISWAVSHEGKTKHQFYKDQHLQAQTRSGIIETYNLPIKNKPGDFLLKNGETILGYLYSTKVNLQDYVGKKVTVLVSPRSNHNFAFDAFFVLAVE